jgi:hypothetical protein
MQVLAPTGDGVVVGPVGDAVETESVGDGIGEGPVGGDGEADGQPSNNQVSENSAISRTVPAFMFVPLDGPGAHGSLSPTGSRELDRKARPCAK